jgi:hypothetical protein
MTSSRKQLFEIESVIHDIEMIDPVFAELMAKHESRIAHPEIQEYLNKTIEEMENP